jgi:hypothetical protein
LRRIALLPGLLTLLLSSGFATAQPAPPVFGPQTFERTAEQGDVYTESFEVPAGGEFVLFLRNGDGESSRVASASVLVNGETVVLPSDLNMEVPGLRRPVLLQGGANELTVELSGQPGSFVTVAILRPGADPVFVHGRLILPWGREDGERALVLALKNGSLHFPRLFRVVFKSPNGQVVAATERLALPPRGSLALPVAGLLDGADWSAGSVEIFFAGPGTGKMFGSARQVGLLGGETDIESLEHAGFRIFRGRPDSPGERPGSRLPL